ncbi:MAG: clostripain-related cysteine peptidase, partial [Patescibacteria group bacterium]
MAKKLLPLMAFLFLLPLLGGCGPQPGAPAVWNFLVYMAADNDLENFAIYDLNEMEQAGPTDEVRILVLFDRGPGYDASNGNWTGTRLYRVTKDNDPYLIRSSLVWAYGTGERDMSDPATLRDFIVYCQTHYPADRTVLTLWNHGSGIWPRVAASGASARGIAWDNNTLGWPWNCLTTDEVALALAGARAVTGQKIDIVNTDACLMQMLEAAYEWRNEVDYLVGSEADVPGYGNDYEAVLAHLAADPGMTAAELAVILVGDYYATYADVSYYDTTYAALSLGAPFDALVSAFTSFAAALHDLPDLAPVHDAWLATTSVGGYNWGDECRDLHDFAGEVQSRAADPGLQTAAAALLTALDGAILTHRETGFYTGRAYGLSILIPNSSEWVNYSGANQYVTLRLSQDTAWDEFVVR